MAKSKNKIFIVWDIKADFHFYVDESSVKTKIDAIKFYIKDQYQSLTEKDSFGEYQVYEVSSWEEYKYSLSALPIFTLINKG